MKLATVLIGLLTFGCSSRVDTPPAESSAPIEVTTQTLRVITADITTDEGGFAIAWAGFPEGNVACELWMTRITERGESTLAASRVAGLASTPSDMVLERVGESFVVLWREDSDLWAAQLDEEGGVLVAPEVIMSAASIATAVHDGLLHLFFERDLSGTDQVHYRPYSAALEPLEAETVLEQGDADQNNVGVAWHQRENVFVVSWDQGYRARWMIFDPSGTSSQSSEMVNDTGERQYAPRTIIDDDGGLFVRWYDADWESATFRYFTDLATPGWPTATRLFPTNRYESLDMAWAQSGEAVTLVWQTDRTTSLPQLELASIRPQIESELYGNSVLAGPELDPVSIRLASGTGLVGATFIGFVNGAPRVFFQRVE